MTVRKMVALAPAARMLLDPDDSTVEELAADVARYCRRYGLPDISLVPPDAEVFAAVLHDALQPRTPEERMALPPDQRECHMAVILADLVASGEPILELIARPAGAAIH